MSLPPKRINKEQLCQTKWLSLVKLTYADPNGTQREWDSVERTTRTNPNTVDAVELICRYKKKGEEDKVILVKQYRPPLDSFCLEFPAGLVDENETAEQAGIREMKEETGFSLSLSDLFVSPPLVQEPGMSNVSASVLYCSVDGDSDENKNAKQNLEPSEFIEVLFFSWNSFFAELSEYQKKTNCAVDSKLYTFAFGLSLQNKK
eukprot:TRINITY_DN11798_c0_g1_i1.p1 TRINITY_DN11798_c0_g1~~TRINITY_DN11798_c0_g1_i1.p1  ORF type:complete len:216 (-),score=66.24 TRINITY_DN11798_c0_g1_i1:195-806(-)